MEAGMFLSEWWYAFVLTLSECVCSHSSNLQGSFLCRCTGYIAFPDSHIFLTAEMFWLTWVSYAKSTSWWLFVWCSFCIKFFFLVEGLLWVRKTIFHLQFSSVAPLMYKFLQKSVFCLFPVTHSWKKHLVYVSFPSGVLWNRYLWSLYNVCPLLTWDSSLVGYW